MKIKESSVKINNKLNIGLFCYHINLDKYGANIDLKDLVKQTEQYSHIVITGSPFEQRDELAKYIKKISKLNPDTTFDIYTKGINRPLGIQSLNNINYFVNIQLKNTNINYNDRIIDKVINWYVEMDANFIFYVFDNNDFEEIELLIQQFIIKKSKVIILPHPDVKEYKAVLGYLTGQCLLKNYNLSFDMERLENDK